MVQTCIQLNPNYQIYSSTNFLLSFLLLTFNFFFLSAGFKVASGLLRCWRKTYKGGQIWSRGLCRPRCVGISIQRCRSRCCPHCRTRRDGLLEEKLLRLPLLVHKKRRKWRRGMYLILFFHFQCLQPENSVLVRSETQLFFLLHSFHLSVSNRSKPISSRSYSSIRFLLPNAALFSSSYTLYKKFPKL